MDDDTDKRIYLYAELLEEAKARITIIENVLNGRGDFHPVVKREFCFLQLRMLCELIALGCLVAHGDITALRLHQVRKNYKADEIIKQLEKLRAYFYPVSVVQNRTGPANFQLTIKDDTQLFPKEALLELYRLTHRYVHRGSLRALMSMEESIDTKFDPNEVLSWAQRITSHLEIHVMAISDTRLLSCFLRNAANNNNVSVGVAEATLPQP